MHSKSRGGGGALATRSRQRAPRDLRRAAAQHVLAYVPTSSYSLRRLLERLCHDPDVPLPAVHCLERAVRPVKRDVQTWHAAVQAVGHVAVLRNLLALATHAETGPLTALFIRNAYARTLRRRERRAAAEAAALEASAVAVTASTEARDTAIEERKRREWLANVFYTDADTGTTDTGTTDAGTTDAGATGTGITDADAATTPLEPLELRNAPLAF